MFHGATVLPDILAGGDISNIRWSFKYHPAPIWWWCYPDLLKGSFSKLFNLTWYFLSWRSHHHHPVCRAPSYFCVGVIFWILSHLPNITLVLNMTMMSSGRSYIRVISFIWVTSVGFLSIRRVHAVEDIGQTFGIGKARGSFSDASGCADEGDYQAGDADVRVIFWVSGYHDGGWWWWRLILVSSGAKALTSYVLTT